MCIKLNSLNSRTKILLGGVCGIVLLTIASLVLLPTVLAQDNSYSSEIQPVFVEEPKFTGDILSLTEIFERSELGVVSITVTKSSE